MNKTLRFFAALAALVPATVSAQTWASWELPQNCAGTVSGSLGSTTVSYDGPYNAVYDSGLNRCLTSGGREFNSPAINYFTSGGTNAYNPTPTNGSFVQFVDMVELNTTGSAYVPIRTSTITFADAVINPYIAIVSAGNNDQVLPAIPVTYTFGQTFRIVSYNAAGGVTPYFGDAGESYALNTDMMSLTAREFSGVIQFFGTFNSLTFTVDNNENWHGLTVGAESVVPEPSSYALIGAGLLGLAVAARRRRSA